MELGGCNMKKKYGIICIILGFIILCSVAVTAMSKNKNKDLFIEDDYYYMTTNEMIDTYLIAAAMYMDFNSPVVLPNVGATDLFREAKDYFEPYKNHSFIKEFAPYVNGYGDINGDAIGILFSCSSDESLSQIRPYDEKYRYGTFKSDDSIDSFLQGLREFYVDSHAKGFFKKQSGIYKEMRSYINEHANERNIQVLLENTEAYLGTKEKHFDKGISYMSVLSVYRPGMASFFSIDSDEGCKVITFLSPNNYKRNPYIFDIDAIAENVIHEVLHTYINGTVYMHRNHIESLMKGKNKEKFMPLKLYQNMPYNRIYDEYFVRALEGRIYKEVYSQKEALNKIINKEMEHGFNQLMGVYLKLEDYEENPKNYEDIDAFLPELIELLGK